VRGDSRRAPRYGPRTRLLMMDGLRQTFGASARPQSQGADPQPGTAQNKNRMPALRAHSTPCGLRIRPCRADTHRTHTQRGGRLRRNGRTLRARTPPLTPDASAHTVLHAATATCPFQ
jgi:hypothetical protein